MADGDKTAQPTGRARGRARGRPRTAEELAAMRRPGESSATPATSTQGLVPGRGRGVSGDREPARGRGVSQERSAAPSVPTGGRAHHRGSVATPGPAGSGSSGMDALSTALSATAIGSSSGSTNGVNGESSTNGNGSAPSVGRGATRGRRDRADEFFTRTRPANLQSKRGEGGTEVNVATNYFEVVSKPNWRLLQYRVDMKPAIEHPGMRKAMLYSHKDTLPKMIFDGTMMFTTNRLTQDKSPKILYSERNTDKAKIEITIKEVGEVQPTDYHYMQFFNIVLRKAMENMQLELIRRDYYDPKAAIILKQHKLELWPGYVTSIRQHEEKILMCCEISHKILRTDTVLDQIGEIHQKTRGGPSFHAEVEKALLGAIIITRYNNKTYRVDEIAWDKKPSDEFEGRNDEKMTYMKYYETRYNKKINDIKQPLLISMPKLREERSGVSGPIFLIPELCNMTGLSDEQRANFNLMKSMGEYTRQDPEKRTKTLLKFADRLKNEPNIKDDMAGWNLKFAEDLHQFRARMLKPETILGSKGSKATYKLENADWAACFRKWNAFATPSCSNWAVVFNPKDEAVVKEFINSLKKVSPSLGLTMAAPKSHMLTDNRPATYIQKLDVVLNEKPQLVMVVIPNDKGDHYAAVKKKCYIEKPTPSQCVTSTVLNKPKGLMSVATKVAVQMICKLGGEPWAVDIPMKGTMVIGYDTYHDSAQKGRSAGALVASLNKTFTKYLSVANLHTNPAQELDDNICPAIARALRKYNDLNGEMPQRIILYRDGVGDGQINYVLEHEIKAIEKCFQAAGINQSELKFTYIIVSKRINTRFFRMNGKPSNPPSGTVVDSDVTLPERYDFFLVSQSVNQGTVNPTSYNVVKDTSGLLPKHIQALTYKLTHLYYNWPGTVRVPAPCQYAHKLAFLVGESLHKEPSPELQETLFYL